MNIEFITETEFEKLDYPIIFYDESTDRCYAKVNKKEIGFKFGWSSDLINPAIMQVYQNVYAIGIDQNFAIINLDNGDIYTKLKLFYNFYEMKLYDNYIIIATELEVIIMNKKTYNVFRALPLLEFYTSIRFIENSIEITCINGDIVMFVL